VGAHDVVGGGGDDGCGDSGGGSWSSEVGRAPPLMPGTAAPATVPAPGGVDDANNAPMAIGGRQRQGWGGATTVTAEQPPIRRGGRQQRGDRCCGKDRCRDDYDGYVNC